MSTCLGCLPACLRPGLIRLTHQPSLVLSNSPSLLCPTRDKTRRDGDGDPLLLLLLAACSSPVIDGTNKPTRAGSTRLGSAVVHTRKKSLAA